MLPAGMFTVSLSSASLPSGRDWPDGSDWSCRSHWPDGTDRSHWSGRGADGTDCPVNICTTRKMP